MLPPFRYEAPRSLSEAFDLLGELPEANLLAGGTDLLVELRSGKKEPRPLIDLKKIPGLRQIQAQNNQIQIGALCTLSDLVASPLVAHSLKALHDAARVFACFEIRNRATIGGNIANASPGAESAIPLRLLEGEVLLQSPTQERRLPFEQFVTGASQTARKHEEIITAFSLPAPTVPFCSAYRRFSRVQGMDLASFSVAISIFHPRSDEERQVRLVMGAVAPTPLRSPEVEDLLSHKPLTPSLLEEASQLLAQQITPRASSLRASPTLKKLAIGRLASSLLFELLGPQLNGATSPSTTPPTTNSFSLQRAD